MYTQSPFESAKYTHSPFQESPMENASQIGTGVTAEKVANVLEQDAMRWERIVKFLNDVQESKASLFAFDDKVRASLSDHCRGLRAMAVEVRNVSTSKPQQEEARERTFALELD